MEEYAGGSWGGRYVPFERGDWATFRDAHTNPEPWHKGGIVNQTGGIVVNRWDVSGARLASYVRPDHPVQVHGHRKPSKYIVPSGRSLPGATKRLDVHPLVRRRACRRCRSAPSESPGRCENQEGSGVWGGASPVRPKPHVGDDPRPPGVPWPA